jgi:hypothetical protein
MSTDKALGMKTASFLYDETLVCAKCFTNDEVHYNLFVKHGESHLRFDPECEQWCEQCAMECELVPYEPMVKKEAINFVVEISELLADHEHYETEYRADLHNLLHFIHKVEEKTE